MTPHQFSQLLLTAAGVRTFVYHQHRIPHEVPVIVVSNHRSFLDPLVLMCGIERSLRTACHHYLGQVPVMRELVQSLGCFPLAQPERRSHTFLTQATRLLHQGQWVCVFPEGAAPMVELTSPWQVGQFQHGFAHLALRAEVPRLVVLPVAIAALQELTTLTIPVRLLSWFDPAEPCFDRPGQHPLVFYQRLNLAIGRPCWIGAHHRQLYRSSQRHEVVTRVNQHCRQEISRLLRQHRHLAIAPTVPSLS
ncbi:MAG: 1-acyl-sn-glycerol-3-phosphate acyltransferase [Spirulinaceae cyanobacterium RM2_2_10]|nr:1-acyl-sn-glycerol-3-phosphate acyltransferase [Spirulinaceae cyanobacterium SM2_1_0]NJO19653.1 1-acyl-sn-glycerol-3-phosphate acyltransferase [Spirulinaceae cyanobacterium RM2_2_10]